MSIDMTTVASSAIVAAIIGAVQLIGNRYTNRALDHIEKALKIKKIIP